MELADFSNYSLEVLLQEPERLEESIKLLKDQFDQSMASNYDFFIKTCERASTITDDLAACTSTVSDLSTSLQDMTGLCSDLCLLAQNTTASNSQISCAFRHLNQITGIMDIPQLMRSCRISALYDEALELYEAIDSFARQFPGIPAVQHTLEKAQVVKAEVAQTLISGFTGRLRVADAVKTVNLLRAAGLHSKGELRLEFVNGRCRKLHQKIAQVQRTPALAFGERATKIYRHRLHKMCTSYRALFHDEDDDATLSMAVHAELTDYVRALREVLDAVQEVDGAQTTMRDALFFVGGIGKLGFNFRPMLDAMFMESKWAK